MVVVIVRDNDRMDCGQILKFKRRLRDAAGPRERHRRCVFTEHGVGEYVDTSMLKQNGRVADPRDRCVGKLIGCGRRGFRGRHNVALAIVALPVAPEPGPDDAKEARVCMLCVRVGEPAIRMM